MHVSHCAIILVFRMKLKSMFCIIINHPAHANGWFRHCWKSIEMARTCTVAQVNEPCDKEIIIKETMFMYQIIQLSVATGDCIIIYNW